MKVSTVTDSYKKGQRDFSNQKLRGQNFAGENLSEANFSNCDIRGANFKGANLTGANFTGAKAGLQKRWMIGLLLIVLILLFIAGISSVFIGGLIAYFFNSSSMAQKVAAWTSLIVLIIFCFFTYFKGLGRGLRVVAIASALIGAIVTSIVFTLMPGSDLAGTVVTAIIVGIVFSIAFAGAFIATFAVVFAVVFIVRDGFTGFGCFILAFSGTKIFAFTGAGNGAFLGAVILALLAYYIAYRAMKGDSRNAWIRNFAVAFAASGGTTFKNTNLTDTNFTKATLKSTDFRQAILIRTCFKNTEKLDRIRPGKTYLSNSNLKQWLIGTGINKNFDRQDLRGVHLQAANLTDASFIGADLSNANLQDADLSRAKLIQTQLDNTDLTGATLTGATIEDWGITSHTNLQGVRCRYIFMREPTKSDPNQRRKPDNWEEEFEDGDFAEFIQPLVNTLDLYHNQGIDPRAIAIAFKQLAEEHPDAELQIVALEKRGDDKLLIRAATAPEANHSELNREYFTNYNQLKILNEQYRARLEEKDSRIQSLETMITTTLAKPSFYYQHQEEFILSKKIDNSQNTNLRDINANQSIVNLGEISGQVSNNIKQLPDNAEGGKANIKDILKELQTAIETEEHLKDVQKFEALEALETLSQAANNPEDSNLKKLARLSKNALFGITSNIPHATQFIQACNELLPAIAKLLKL
ncbi:pentapeptide repeat-containing protein [Crocosphaera chwakensis]|uniref:Pentapeptide repeat n=1 Tax=Crocosphaera chwakensis CCY0110 TaxID=391612 RepID=A3ITH1_9CHRO|nr:pentapeptide repeat-containing protein [Crocosphaera chwakensis]EAZ90256.1 hypothetical protein CY0110_04573 [Crocosphaera chwakensis CCY0110]